MYKTILPEAYQFGQSPVQIIQVGARGLNKTAMRKRASAFDDTISQLQPKKGQVYLHVITTGALQQYGPNQNGDGWVGYSHTYRPPFPKQASVRQIKLDGGLQKYHDTTYMQGAKVYQQHQTQRQGAEASGFIKAAKYNQAMHRGQLLICVDQNKWQQRLHKKASGQDIFLSIGADVSRDICSVCGNHAKNTKQYCNHVKQARLQVDDKGNQVYMLNDDPKFYDISGVDVPADKMAFVLRKVASGASAQSAISTARYNFGVRRPMPFNKAASALTKLSNIQKQISCQVVPAGAMFSQQPGTGQRFILKVKGYPVDQVISGCNRKGMLLTPDIFFKLLGGQSLFGDTFGSLGQCCCKHCGGLMQRMANDQDFIPMLMDGAFDSDAPADLNLNNILQQFMPQLGVTRPCINKNVIKITIAGKPEQVTKVTEKIKTSIKDVLQQLKDNQQDKGDQKQQSQDMQKTASLVQKQLQRTYARYLVSFAAVNSEDTCQFALRKLACYNN